MGLDYKKYLGSACLKEEEENNSISCNMFMVLVLDFCILIGMKFVSVAFTISPI